MAIIFWSQISPKDGKKYKPKVTLSLPKIM